MMIDLTLKQAEAIRLAGFWWHCVQAGRTLDGEPPLPADMPILHYCAHGTSAMVLVEHLNALATINTVPLGSEPRRAEYAPPAWTPAPAPVFVPEPSYRPSTWSEPEAPPGPPIASGGGGDYGGGGASGSYDEPAAASASAPDPAPSSSGGDP